MSLSSALKELNVNWFTRLRPRWVDIIGAYAGKETFLVDGDALIQYVLDDHLLGIGKQHSTDWQILHAVWSIESTLWELKKRGGEFDIAFFTTNRALSIGPTSSKWISRSRSLAHAYLKAYIESLEFDVYEFEDLEDEDWEEYMRLNKPLFILSNDQSLPLPSSPDEVQHAVALLHRLFIFKTHTQGLHLASLRSLDFRDSQANTFLYSNREKFSHPNEEEEKTEKTEASWKLVEEAEKDAQELVDSLVPEIEKDEEAEDIESWPLTALKLLSPSSPTQAALLYAFLAHTQLLDTIELSDRSLPTPVLPSTLKESIQDFLLEVFESLEKTIPEEVEEPPLVDGRVFTLLVGELMRANDIESVLGSGILAKVNGTWEELGQSPVDFGSLRQSCGGEAVTYAEAKAFDEFALYPFTTPLLSDSLSEVDAPIKQAQSVPPLQPFPPTSIFAPQPRLTTYRSPLPKHLGGETAKPKDRKSALRLLRKNQRDMVHIERQAGSLTGAGGRGLEQEVIVATGVYLSGTASYFASHSGSVAGSQVGSVIGSPTGSRAETPEVMAKGPKGKKARPEPAVKGSKGGGKGKKDPPMKSADKLRAQIEAQKKIKNVSDAENWWKGKLDEYAEMEVKERIEALDLVLAGNKRLEGEDGRSLAANVRLFRINSEVWKWIEDPFKTKPEIADKYRVSLLKMTFDMRRYSDVLTPTMVKCLWSLLEVLGFEDYVETIPKPAKGVQDKKLRWDFVKFYRKAKTGANAGEIMHTYPWMTIREDPIDWQLRVFGEHMDRSFDSKPDSRVKFEPDKWQRDVLDRLDRDESVLVVAPTSAGKTFISYYAMKQVLTSSDDGILVYVAPTKALVTQITAEVYARYRKDMKGRSCWAIHTSDIRMNNPQTCQILVTVPEMLAFMLLQPNLAKLWTPRIRRIILDEIHTLGTQSGGVWEQILLLARCPIIGLSATVGDAEAFNEWLKSVQNEHGHEHSLVQHQHRYSHLRKFTYNLDPDPDPIDGLPSHKPSPQLRFLHPISFIRPGITELPSDLALEARDCATLYKAMADNSKEPAVAKLKPTKFFEKQAENGHFLQQIDIIRYEEALKKQLTKWLEADDAHKESSLIQKVVKQLSDKEVGTESSQKALEDPDLFYKNLVNLLADLNASGDLPALLFHFDRYTVEAIAKAILERLKKDEAEWRKTSPEWEKKLKGWQAWEAGAKEREKAAQRAAQKKEKAEGDKMERLQNAASVDSSPLAIYANFDPDAPSEEFSFINWGTRYSASELDEDIKNLDRYSTTPKFLFECLRRGIAVHHSGLAKGYRVLVESLFRIGFVRVVISTEDLALGVNMPAKASVFCGDSPALTALMYRQCAGRAGRRGFDLLGKVIFYGLTHERVKQVVLSRLPALRGNYPLTPTLSLRLVNLLTDSGYAPSAANAVRDLLRLDGLTVGSDISREQTLYNMRFSIEYLIRTRTLEPSGSALHPWYNFATFLYSNEPANFALLSLFRAGYIHKICDTSRPGYNIIDAKRNLMHILSFLFCRQYISRTSFDKGIFAVYNRTPSKVILPELDPEAVQILREHNQEVLTVFTECAVMYAMQHEDDLGTDNELPMSGRTIEAISSKTPSPFVQGLKRARLPVRSRSAFVAISGHGDVYEDVDELVRTARKGIHLTKHVFPSLDIFDTNSDTTSRYVNAYLYDFYMHGQDKPLSDGNGIPKGQVWYLLLDFSYAMDGMVTAIKELLLKDTRKIEDDTTSVAGESVAAVQDDWAGDDLEKDETVATAGSVAGGPVEKEKGDDLQALAAAGSDTELAKPAHVSVADWAVYEAFFHLQKDFNEKFMAMWA